MFMDAAFRPMQREECYSSADDTSGASAYNRVRVRQTHAALLYAALAWCLCGAASVQADQNVLLFGVFPRWNAAITVREYTPLVEELSRELGRTVRIETDKDFESFMRRTYGREFDIIHVNQLQYVRAHTRAGYQAIARICEDPYCMIAAAIVTRTDTGISTINDLRGKTIAFGDRNAMVSHILAKALLLEFGVHPSDYKSIFTKNPPNALLAVYNRTADAAGIGSNLLTRRELRQRMDVSALKVLAESRPIPQLPVAVRAGLEPILVERIKSALLTLEARPRGREALRHAGILRFEAAVDADYDVVRKIVNEVDA